MDLVTVLITALAALVGALGIYAWLRAIGEALQMEERDGR